ncbi:unnamed protein product [Nezara viridula]|uniref:Neuropeptide n=1 Tax=Nezara viridula TaxID=85310 RepID=A0A9P0E5Q1_NEZVI|nr:unnamed protein product [Nezara viridula]
MRILPFFYSIVFMVYTTGTPLNVENDQITIRSISREKQDDYIILKLQDKPIVMLFSEDISNGKKKKMFLVETGPQAEKITNELYNSKLDKAAK